METAKPLNFSVVMCNLNEIRLIRQSLNSLKNQTLRPEEIIVVDGGSIDGSLEVAQALADKIYGPVKGVGTSRLKGILASKGDFICSANSDTIYPKHYLEDASTHLSNPEVEAVTGPSMPIPGKPFNIIGQAQGIFSHALYLMLPHVYEHNLCFKKAAFIQSKLKLEGYWMKSVIGNPSADIGYFMRHALNPRWEQDMACFTRLPTRNVSLKKISIYLLRLAKEGGLVTFVKRISKI